MSDQEKYNIYQYDSTSLYGRRKIGEIEKEEPSLGDDNASVVTGILGILGLLIAIASPFLIWVVAYESLSRGDFEIIAFVLPVMLSCALTIRHVRLKGNAGGVTFGIITNCIITFVVCLVDAIVGSKGIKGISLKEVLMIPFVAWAFAALPVRIVIFVLSVFCRSLYGKAPGKVLNAFIVSFAIATIVAPFIFFS